MNVVNEVTLLEIAEADEAQVEIVLTGTEEIEEAVTDVTHVVTQDVTHEATHEACLEVRISHDQSGIVAHRLEEIVDHQDHLDLVQGNY